MHGLPHLRDSLLIPLREALQPAPSTDKSSEEFSALADSFTICKFGLHALRGLDLEEMAEVIYAATDWHVTAREALEVGEMIVNLERLCDVREGITRKDDMLPARYFSEPLPDGASKGEVVELEPMLERYYELRG